MILPKDARIPNKTHQSASIACASSSWTPAWSIGQLVNSPGSLGKGKLMMASNGSYGWWEKILVNHWWKHSESWDISFHSSWCRILSTACRDCSKVSSTFSVGFHWENVWNTFLPSGKRCWKSSAFLAGRVMESFQRSGRVGPFVLHLLNLVKQPLAILCCNGIIHLLFLTDLKYTGGSAEMRSGDMSTEIMFRLVTKKYYSTLYNRVSS